MNWKKEIFNSFFPPSSLEFATTNRANWIIIISFPFPFHFPFIPSISSQKDKEAEREKRVHKKKNRERSRNQANLIIGPNQLIDGAFLQRLEIEVNRFHTSIVGFLHVVLQVLLDSPEFLREFIHKILKFLQLLLGHNAWEMEREKNKGGE